MPLAIPTLDDRRYQDLLDEALARIPVHNPEWTNFNESDPGVTVLEVFAFLTETLLYRANQIPERNRRKFLTLLGVPLAPAAAATGIVQVQNARGPLATITLAGGLETRAGQIPFRTEAGLDVLPIEAQCFYKEAVAAPDADVTAYYRQLYAAALGTAPVADPQLYRTLPFPAPGTPSVDLAATIDRSLWIALLVREADGPAAVERVREAIAGKTVNVGVVPALDDARRDLAPGGAANVESRPLLGWEMPSVPGDGRLPADRTPPYRPLDASATVDVLAEPGIVQVTLPAATDLRLWTDLDPLEAGVGDFPPALDDTTAGTRLVTWLRLHAAPGARARLHWIGINAVRVTQRARVTNELLPAGSGEPDQQATLARRPVVPGSVEIAITANGRTESWTEIDDILAAGPEVPVPEQRRPPGTPPPEPAPARVFVLDAEAGLVRFGDGLRGARPPADATVRAAYDYGVGRAGNVGPEAITVAPALPGGLTVTNPVRTWGGADAETVAEGEKRIPRFLRHRERAVSALDFEDVVRRTPGVEIGRVDVLPAYQPSLGANEPGDAPGAVTVMVLPATDAVHPDAPRPDQLFIDTVACWLEPRRLVTTQVFVRPPVYRDVWISVGVDVRAGASIAVVREAVKRAVLDHLAPLPPPSAGGATADATGWPLRKPVVALALGAVVARAVPDVVLVNGVRLAERSGASVGQIALTGLELPRVAGITVSIGEPIDPPNQPPVDAAAAPATAVVPVPVVPEEC